MASPSPQALEILAQLNDKAVAYKESAVGAREQLMNLAYALIADLELPSETVQRMGWAEACLFLIISSQHKLFTTDLIPKQRSSLILLFNNHLFILIGCIHSRKKIVH